MILSAPRNKFKLGRIIFSQIWQIPCETKSLIIFQEDPGTTLLSSSPRPLIIKMYNIMMRRRKRYTTLYGIDTTTHGDCCDDE